MKNLNSHQLKIWNFKCEWVGLVSKVHFYRKWFCPLYKLNDSSLKLECHGYKFREYPLFHLSPKDTLVSELYNWLQTTMSCELKYFCKWLMGKYLTVLQPKTLVFLLVFVVYFITTWANWNTMTKIQLYLSVKLDTLEYLRFYLTCKLIN